MATNVIRLNKDGQIEVDGVVFDIREFINKIDKKVNLFIQDNKPEEYGLLDFWYAPTDDILSVSKFINNELVFIEVTLAGKTLSASISGGTGGVSQDAINNLASSLSAQIESVRTEMRSTFKDTINLSSITAYHLISGDISVSNEVISNGVGIYTYTGNTTTPPSIPLLMPIAGQWGDQVTETYGYMIEIRSRSAAGNWSIINSISGQNKYLDYNSCGVEVTDSTLISSITTTNGLSTINLGSSSRVNTNGVTYVMTVWQTTHQRSELTNQGKPAYTHYNPWSGFTINAFTGTQLANHKINHYLNRKIDLLFTKNLSLTDTMWCITGEVLGDSNRLILGNTPVPFPTFTSNMAVHQGQYMVQYTDGYITGSSGAWENGEGHAMISFGWASSYIDDSGKLIGNFEIGKWKGTGVVGTNIITPREKPARLMFKGLSAGEKWYLKDNMREGFTGNLTLEINSMAAEYPNGTMRTSGKNIISFDNILGNTVAKEYLYFIVYDNTNGTGKSTYLKPSDNPNININNCIIPFVNGVDTRGQKMVTISKSETITGLTYTPGTNYVWYDKLGNKSSTPSRPRYSYSDLDAEFPGDAPDLLVEDLNMWYSTSSSADLYPNGKLLSVASGEIGYDNGNGTVVGYTIPVTATLSVVNNQLKVSGSQHATARMQLTGLTPGKEYYFSCTIIKGTTTNPYIEMYIDNDSATVAPIKSGRIGVDSILYKFIPVGTTKYIRFVNTNAVETGYALFDNMRVWEANCVVGSPITNSRNYLNHIFHTDAYGNLIREEEIVKTKYLNNVRIENLESVTGKAITQSVIDTTKGKLLKVGDYGLGLINIITATDLNTVLVSGKYYSNSLCTNTPDGGNGYLTVEYLEPGYCLQTFTNVVSGTVFNRVMYNGTWGKWVPATLLNGTFTPYVVGLTSNGVGTYNMQSGTYSRVGNRVNFEIFINVATHTGTGNVVIAGLPFICRSYSALGVSHIHMVTYAGTQVSAYTEAGSQYINLVTSTSNGGLSALPIDTNFAIMVSGSYITDL